MIEHPVFSASSQIHEFDAGIRSDLVCKDLPKAKVRAELENCFKYNHIPEENPNNMILFEPCRHRKGGFCDSDDGFAYAHSLTHNLYEHGKAWKPDGPSKASP